MSAPLGVILAGGRATRMGGGDKGLLPLGSDPGGATILDEVIARLAPQVPRMALNANGAAERFARYDMPVLPDSLAGHPGPLAGVLAGLDWAAGEGAGSIVTVAADTPFFPFDLVQKLREAAAGMDHPLALAATPDGRQPTFGLWPVALRNDLRRALEEGLRKVVMWTDQHDGREAMFEDESNPFFNVNTPDDLAQAQEMAKGQA